MKILSTVAVVISAVFLSSASVRSPQLTTSAALGGVFRVERIVLGTRRGDLYEDGRNG